MENKCENLSLYIIDELSEHEKEQFERHLKTCIPCQNEIDSLQEAWQVLSYDIEETDVPESLKAEVMNFIFEEENSLKTNEVKDKKHSFLERFKLLLTKQFSPLSAGITAVLIMGLIGLLWSNLQLKDTIIALENQSVSPTQIVRTFNLKGQDLATSANGIAYLLQDGRDNSLVIELNNMPGTKDDEVYQVWLLKNGNRQNAGTLKPDENGNGLITYRLPKNHSFDDIGITLEPNPNNTQPQGHKVMGTT
ncbi:anti-sigma factor [Paenisporosarcina sp. OV554]|uniref:anti-sigma factor n=1 Tax=Paenisporosarcina sp. OV554 TaxID=2135694 RepID=UPI000D393F34|nr:anti-sigma factor [Paenisporosarcina sp. OV554]PUB10113.1 anti-sigma-K factor rskA [Paenisporosarcina sp. OV554]